MHLHPTTKSREKASRQVGLGLSQEHRVLFSTLFPLLSFFISLIHSFLLAFINIQKCIVLKRKSFNILWAIGISDSFRYCCTSGLAAVNNQQTPFIEHQPLFCNLHSLVWVSIAFLFCHREDYLPDPFLYFHWSPFILPVYQNSLI